MEQFSINEAPRIQALNEPHLACVLLMDTSGSMTYDIDDLNKAINNFSKNVSMDEISKQRVDVAVMAFDDEPRLVMPFTPVSEMECVRLDCGGCTQMGKALDAAIDLVKERNRFYNNLGTPVFRPWIFMMTDGAPTDDISGVAQRIKKEEDAKKLKLFIVGTRDYDKNEMFKLSNRVIELQNANFEGIFNWLSQSMVTISVSKPSDEATLSPLPEDAKKAERDVSDW